MCTRRALPRDYTCDQDGFELGMLCVDLNVVEQLHGGASVGGRELRLYYQILEVKKIVVKTYSGVRRTFHTAKDKFQQNIKEQL
ncbi:hypothetical protein NDU88_005881 [Pleurodeles waltl]|uniref:Non-specific serine/threonine protein kinase n=1 Tax=Pleurodeles waltl TaxID=8319 RepID=A0AAV7NRN4_PLEWA|nr:hypothetical protein NDU88_005881 [Pleurodeles waltl]